MNINNPDSYLILFALSFTDIALFCTIDGSCHLLQEPTVVIVDTPPTHIVCGLVAGVVDAAVAVVVASWAGVGQTLLHLLYLENRIKLLSKRVIFE